MAFNFADTDVVLNFDLNLAGAIPESVEWRVESATDIIQNWTAITGMTDDQLTLIVPAALNALPSGETTGHRIVTVRLKPSNPSHYTYFEIDYGITVNEVLVVQVNSFMTYNEAVALSHNMINVDDFRNASKDDRIRALMNAWNVIVKLKVEIEFDDDMTRITEVPWDTSPDLTDLSAEQFNGLDDELITALKRAQIVEANMLLSGDEVDDARSAGLLSSTIGETSQMFRSAKPLQLAANKRTLNELRGFLSGSVRLARG